MKRNIYLWLPGCLAMGILGLIGQSCSIITAKEMRGSIDNYKQVYRYHNSQDSPSGSDFGLNVAATIMTSPGHIPVGRMSKSGVPRNGLGKIPNNLYANANPSFLPLDITEKSGYSFVDHIRFFSGLEYILKRAKDGGRKINMNYLEIPVQALYFHELPQEKGAIYGGLGPYLAYGLGGKIKSSYGGVKEKTKSFDKDDGFKRFDAGIVASIGYKMPESFSFTFSYEWGLANISREPSNPILGDVKVRNKMFSLNVGYPISKLLPKK